MKKNILPIVLIIVFLTLIILPPLFRNIYPLKTPENIQDNVLTTDSKENRTLTCITDTSDYYTVTYKTYYQSGRIVKITITYLDKLNDRNNDNYSATSNQMNFFAALKGSTYNYINSNMIITLTQKVYENNKNDDTLKNMYDNYSSLKKYYTKLGYDCK